MTSSATPNAYLVMAMVSEEGKLLLQSETICFDRELAFSIADDEGDHRTWVGVYALDAEGRSLQNSAVYCSGCLHAPVTGSHHHLAGGPLDGVIFS